MIERIFGGVIVIILGCIFAFGFNKDAFKIAFVLFVGALVFSLIFSAIHYGVLKLVEST